MKLSFLLFSGLIAASNGFSTSLHNSRPETSLRAALDEAELSADQLEIKRIQEKWNEVRMMTKEDAAGLEGEWKEAYDRFHEKYDKDMELMEEITTRVQKMIEPPKVEKKTKGQRKRDAWARVQEREAARAAAK